MINVFVVNLKKSTERRKEIEAWLRKTGLEFKIVEAVDGRTFSDEEFERLDRVKGLSKSEYGCMRSHLNIYEEMQSLPEQYALILEDDILFREMQMSSLLNELMPFLDEDKITLLHYYWCREGALRLFPQNEFQISGKPYYVCEPSEIWGIGKSSAYLISKNTAKKIVDYQTPTVKTVADAWIVYFNEKIIPGVDCIFPMPVDDNNNFGSDIGYSKNKIQAMLKNSLISAGGKFPFVRKLLALRRRNYTRRFRNIRLGNEPFSDF